MPTHLLLIDCPDAKGLVHNITGVLFRRDFNIVGNQEFVEPTRERFFMRTAFSGEGDPLPLVRELQSLLPPQATVHLAPTGKRPIVLLATKEPHCLGDLLLRHAYEELPAKICAVVGNHDSLEPLVRQFGIPFHFVSHLGFERAEHEAALQAAIAPYQPEYLVLAKYMRVLSPDFVAHWPNKIVNIHHSFLPAFAGANPYRQAYERGVKIIGATAHFVTDHLDEGPIIAQAIQPVDHTFQAGDMAQTGRDVEKLVLAKALRLVLEERVFLFGNRTVIFE